MLVAAIVADDLTGACDAGVQFAMRGHSTAACLNLDRAPDHAAVLALSTETRDADLKGIRAAMAAAALRFAGAQIIFKKIDSMLRGNVGGEITAALEAFHCEIAVVTPAFPSLGRIVDGGYLRMKGATDFEPIEVAARLCEQGLDSTRFLSMDAICDEDLDKLVCAGLSLQKRVLWAGSGGLAAAVARCSGVANPQPSRGGQAGPAVFCIGSDHEVTQTQLRTLLASRPSTRVLRIERSTSPERVRESLADARPAMGALVLSGGDTASLVCRALGVRYIELSGEIAPGIPHGALRGGLFDTMPVATKSGAFGRPQSLVEVANFFTCPKE